MTHRSRGYIAPTHDLSDRELERLTEELAVGARAVTMDVPDLVEGLVRSVRSFTRPIHDHSKHPWKTRPRKNSKQGA